MPRVNKGGKVAGRIISNKTKKPKFPSKIIHGRGMFAEDRNWGGVRRLSLSAKLRNEVYPHSVRRSYIWTPQRDPERDYEDYSRIFTPYDRPIPCEICGEVQWWDGWYNNHVYYKDPLFFCKKHTDFEVKVWQASKGIQTTSNQK